VFDSTQRVVVKATPFSKYKMKNKHFDKRVQQVLCFDREKFKSSLKRQDRKSRHMEASQSCWRHAV